MLILGNSVTASSIAKTVVKNVHGFVTLVNNTMYKISENGIEPFTPTNSDKFVLGELSHEKRILYIDYISKYVTISKDNFPNIIAHNADTSCIESIGFGNIIANNATLQDITLGNFNYVGNNALLNSKSVVGSYNVFREQVCVGYSCSVGDYNILNTKAVIADDIILGSYNIVSHSECVFDDIGNYKLFQSGITQNI